MAQPFDFRLQLQDPANAVTAGLQQGIQLGGMMERADLLAAQKQQTLLENQALQAKAQRAQQFQGELGKLGAEGFSSKSLNELMLKYPEAVEQLKTPFANLSNQEREAKVAEIMPVVSAINAGDRVTAGQLLDKQVEALRNAGKTREADAAEVQKNLVLFGDLNAAQTSLNTAVAMAMGPEKYNETFVKLEDQRRDRMLEESKNLKEYSDAKIAEAKAEFARVREQLEVDKLKPKPVGVGGAAAPKPALSLKDQLNTEGKLRDDFNNAMKPISEMSYSFQRLNAAQDDAAGDLALIFNYMKMLDPGSAVREGEFANAQNAAGVPDQIRNQWNKLKSGERLNPEQRISFKTQAAKILEPYKKQGERLRTTYTSEAKRIGIEPSAIFLSAPQEEQPQAAPQPGPVMTPAQPRATQAAPAMTPATGGGWSIVSVTKGK
jgi:hypothetical protein